MVAAMRHATGTVRILGDREDQLGREMLAAAVLHWFEEGTSFSRPVC